MMMKALWTIISTVAVANILALLGFIGWLGMTDRLSRERVEQVRIAFAPTLAQEQAAKADEQARADAEALVIQAKARMAVAPEAAADRIAQHEQAEEVRLQHILRQQRELEDLRRTLERDRSRLAEEERRLMEAQEGFAAYRRKLAEIEGADQFRKALATLEAQKPKDAKNILQSLIDQSDTDQAVAYLGAMDERVRGKVMAEFVRDDADLAADLLERLRTRGTMLPGAEARAP